MSSFGAKKSPGYEAKSSTLGSRRTLLQDNSWIKNRPEEEIKDENYGKAALSRYKSEDALDSYDGVEQNKGIHNRFRSDDALNRIPSKPVADIEKKASTLERFSTSTTSTDKSLDGSKTKPWNSTSTTTTATTKETKRQSWTPANKTTTTEETKRQSWAPSNKTFTTTVETTEQSRTPANKTTTTEETKRQSWSPSNKTFTTTVETTDTTYSSDSSNEKPRSNLVESARARFEKVDEKPTSPTLYSKDSKPKVSPPKTPPQSIQNDRPKVSPPPVPLPSDQESKLKGPLPAPPASPTKGGRVAYPPKPVISDNSERRSASERKAKSQELENLIGDSHTTVKTIKSQTFENVSETSSTAGTNKKGVRDQNVGDLIDSESAAMKSNKSSIEVTSTTGINKKGGQDLGKLIEIGNATGSSSRSQSLDNLIDVSSSAGKKDKSQNLENLIEISSTAGQKDKRDKGSLDSLIEIKSGAGKGSKKEQDLDSLIDIKSTAGKNNKRNDYLGDLVAIVPNAEKENKGGETRTSSRSSDVIINRDPYATSRSTRSVDYSYDTPDAPNRKSSSSYSYDTRSNSSSSNSHSSPGDTYVYTRTYEENSQPRDRYEDNVTKKAIKTVYSTADRSVIEKDMCTYCRKPLSIDPKMILEDLNICCHATCFKCEVCKSTLEHLNAGDSMWIYKQTIHCAPCYLSVRDKWMR
ncbi:hypothetical protein NDU88_003708 [Pleurodeles waltl]|uniref:LIM zinc-binding domain-containing protein n=1 Tax=Pleurodeles waltl TaxID=8319 RepID=A0AAV7NIV8_PLEWA|nr:hypothetical protein NDU88_003708 [Pleurodeles waltl]